MWKTVKKVWILLIVFSEMFRNFAKRYFPKFREINRNWPKFTETYSYSWKGLIFSLIIHLRCERLLKKKICILLIFFVRNFPKFREITEISRNATYRNLPKFYRNFAKFREINRNWPKFRETDYEFRWKP